MLRVIWERLKQGHRTIAYPKAPPALPERYRGCPVLSPEKCGADCDRCVSVCPTQAIEKKGNSLRLDLGRCLFCGDCEEACSSGAIRFGQDHRLAVRNREDLMMEGRALRLAESLDRKARRLFGRSLKLRQVSAGGCNACEADVNVLNTVVFDLGRFGIQFVASPRHADGLLITGPVPANVRLALQKTYAAVPAPKIVIAVGACAVSGGPYYDHADVLSGRSDLPPVDLFVPGCPPHPVTILDGLLRLLDRL
ncbi:MAG TPA: hydrogenase [Elusimicrobiota bacterium]|nr:hydrogenase [Elusimicrobiota bacterium]